MALTKSQVENFTTPPSEFRGKPFWAWNGKLEPEELRRQIGIMKKMGFGGFFMHSRVGLDTPYLGDEWFRCVDACIDEAGKQGMEAWLYDEDRWPSGFAGGLVTKNPRYRMRRLRIDVIGPGRAPKPGKGLLAAFSAVLDENRASDVERIAASKIKPHPNSSVILFSEEINPADDWHNGAAYLDTSNHEAVREFINVTHEAYRKRVGSRFGKAVPGIFTDEPNYYDGWDPGNLASRFPWTRDLPAIFKKRFGYDMIDHLVEIFFDVGDGGVNRPRHHYHELMTALFVDAFGRQIGEWCEKNNVAFTGHVLAEELLSSQTERVGSCMRFYEHMQAPGMDILTQYSREYDTAKQVASVARQFNRKWRLSETYGCTGWDFSFAGHKAVGDWQTALGINLRCQHLAWYTMEGEAKRDYPAAIFYQSPWWEHYRHVEDYFSRIHAVMTTGTDVRDILVVHPVESMWQTVKYGAKRSKEGNTLDRALIALRDSLLGVNLDFDYGDEDIMHRHGRVTTGNTTPLLHINKATYKAVVVPAMLTIRSTTLALLERFSDAGGTVVFAGSVPRCVDALVSKRALELAGRSKKSPASGLAAALPATCRRVSIADKQGREISGTLFLLTENEHAFNLFVANTGHAFSSLPKGGLEDTHVDERSRSLDAVYITGFSGCGGEPLELDPGTGAIAAAHARRIKGGAWSIETSLAPLGSRLFVIPKKTSKQKYPRPVSAKTLRSSRIAPSAWGIVLSEDNALVLDRPFFTLRKGKEHGPDEILRVDNRVRESLGLRPRGGEMVQPWAAAKIKTPPTLPIKLRYEFDVRAIPSGRIAVGIEELGRYSICINNSAVNPETASGWWTDRSLRMVPFEPSLLRIGRNELTLSGLYDQNSAGLEIVYLLGNFGTRVSGTAVSVVAPAQTLALGNWVTKGLSFYGGSVGYTARIKPKIGRGERLFVKVPGYRGSAVRVLVDGVSAGIIGWEPNEVEITGLVARNKESLLCIEVIGHRRNSHGPFHLKDKRPHWTGPAQFKSEGDHWVDGYNLVPAGLMDAPVLIYRQ